MEFLKDLLYKLSVMVVSWAIIVGLVTHFFPNLLPTLGRIVLNAV